MTNDVVRVNGQSRVKFVNGDPLNELSIRTLTATLHNISGSAQSTSLTWTVLVSVVGSGVVNHLSISSSSSTYDIGFEHIYMMSFHAGHTSSEFATMKVVAIKQAIERGKFENKLRGLARDLNATQLLNGTCREVTSLTSSIETNEGSRKDDDSLPTGSVVGIVVGVLGGCLLLFIGLYVILVKLDEDKKKKKNEGIEKDGNGNERTKFEGKNYDFEITEKVIISL